MPKVKTVSKLSDMIDGLDPDWMGFVQKHPSLAQLSKDEKRELAEDLDDFWHEHFVRIRAHQRLGRIESYIDLLNDAVQDQLRGSTQDFIDHFRNTMRGFKKIHDPIYDEPLR